MRPIFHSCVFKIWPGFTEQCQNTSARLTRERNTASSVLLREQKRERHLSPRGSNLRNTYCCFPSWDLKHIRHHPVLVASNVCFALPLRCSGGQTCPMALPSVSSSRSFGSSTSVQGTQQAASILPATKDTSRPPKNKQVWDAIQCCLFFWKVNSFAKTSASRSFNFWWKPVSAAGVRKHPPYNMWKTSLNKFILKRKTNEIAQRKNSHSY